MAAGALALADAATISQHCVEVVEARRLRDRRHEVEPGMLHQPLDLTLVVALARAAEAVAEQVMARELGEGAGPLACSIKRMDSSPARTREKPCGLFYRR